MPFARNKELKNDINYKNYLVSPEAITASHQRSRAIKVNSKLTYIPQLADRLYIDNILAGSRQLLSVAKPVIKHDMYPYFIDEDQLIILCNHEGYSIYLLSSPKILQLCYDMNISLGACFREEVCGTNAIALAMHLKKLVLIKGEQHYCQLFKDWSCIAVPIRLPDGDIIGYLDVSMDREEVLVHTLAMVHVTVKYIEKILGEQLSPKTAKTIVSPETLRAFETLSNREKQVFASMGKGQTAGEISKTLGISETTVKTYRHRIYKKLGIKNKIDCLSKARELGFPTNSLSTQRGTE